MQLAGYDTTQLACEAVPPWLRGSVWSGIRGGLVGVRCAHAAWRLGSLSVRQCPWVSATHTPVGTLLRRGCHDLKIDANPAARASSSSPGGGVAGDHGRGAACACDRPRELTAPTARKQVEGPRLPDSPQPRQAGQGRALETGGERGTSKGHRSPARAPSLHPLRWQSAEATAMDLLQRRWRERAAGDGTRE